MNHLCKIFCLILLCTSSYAMDLPGEGDKQPSTGGNSHVSSVQTTNYDYAKEEAKEARCEQIKRVIIYVGGPLTFACLGTYLGLEYSTMLSRNEFVAAVGRYFYYAAYVPGIIASITYSTLKGPLFECPTNVDEAENSLFSDLSVFEATVEEEEQAIKDNAQEIFSHPTMMADLSLKDALVLVIINKDEVQKNLQHLSKSVRERITTLLTIANKDKELSNYALVHELKDDPFFLVGLANLIDEEDLKNYSPRLRQEFLRLQSHEDLDEDDFERFPRADKIAYTFLYEGAALDFAILQRLQQKQIK